jgi:hypothetical protein
MTLVRANTHRRLSALADVILAEPEGATARLAAAILVAELDDLRVVAL